MSKLLSTAAVSALFLAGCATPEAPPCEDPFREVDASEPARHRTAIESFAVALWLEDAEGGPLAPLDLTALTARPSHARTTKEFPYVADFPAEMDKFWLPPLIETIEESMSVEVCVRRDGAEDVALGYRIRRESIERPVAEFRTTMANGPPVVIQLPEMGHLEVEGARRLRLGDRQLLERVPRAHGTGAVLVFARVEPTSTFSGSDAEDR